MFTKYSGITIPKNYSGSRFKEPVLDTEMKTHRGQITTVNKSGVKTSSSQSFQNIIDSVAEEKPSVENNELTEVFEKDDDGNEIEETVSDNNAEETQATVSEEEAPKDAPVSVVKGMVDDTLSRLIGNIGKDELLLLALLLLIASDSQENGIEGVILLALLLLYH